MRAGQWLVAADRVLLPGAPPDATAVLTDQGKVQRFGTRERLLAEHPLPADRVRVFRGCSIRSGLVDAHVHLALDGTPGCAEKYATQSDDQRMRTMRSSAEALVNAGVTAVRDMGGPPHLLQRLVRAIEVGTAPGPTIAHAGAPLTTVGGHCHFFGGAAAAPAEFTRLLEDHARSGASWCKIMVSGGFITPGSSPYRVQFSAVQVLALTREAHRMGLKVAAHAHGRDAIVLALDAGVDTIEHASFLETAGFRCDPEVRERLAASTTIVCPTVAVTALKSPNWPARRDVLRELWQGGVTLAAGTDCGIPDTPHGAYVSGLTALEEVSGSRPGVLGQVEQARSLLGLQADAADFVVVRGVEGDDLDSLRSPVAVVAAGRLISSGGS